MRTSISWLFAAIILLASPLVNATQLVVQTVDEDGNWVQNVLVSVEGAGVSGYTQGAGIWETDIDPGDVKVTARHPAYEMVTEDVSIAGDVVQRRLIMKEGYVGFDVTAHVYCVFSSVNLHNSDVTFERASSAGGETVDTITVRADENGVATAAGLTTGHYRIIVNRADWEPGTFPADGGTVQLAAGQSISIGLEPIKRDGGMIIEGFDPFATGPGLPLRHRKLHGVAVDVTGLDWDEDTEVVPTKRVYTVSSGTTEIPGLPAIPHRFTFHDPNYRPLSIVVPPERLGAVEEELELIPTELEVLVDSPYQGADRVRVTVERLALDGRVLEQFVDAELQADGYYHALLENLAGGRYEVSVSGGGQLDTSTGNGPVLEGPEMVTWQQALADPEFVELATGDSSSIRVRTVPRMTTVTGHLEELDRGGTRKLELADVRVEFVSWSEDNQYADPPSPYATVETTTDARGHFEVQLPHGRWGIRMPDLTTHTTGAVSRDGASTAKWPHSEPWPYPTIPPSYPEIGGARAFPNPSSTAEHLTVVLAKKEVSRVIPLPVDWGTYTVVYGVFDDQYFTAPRPVLPSPDLAVLVDGVEFPWENLGRGRTQRSSETRILVDGIGPGNHTIQLSHPHYDFPSIGFDVPDWDPPGFVPSEVYWSDNGGTPYVQPGLGWEQEIEAVFRPTIKPEYDLTGTIDVNFSRWCANCNPAEYRPAVKWEVEWVSEVPGVVGAYWLRPLGVANVPDAFDKPTPFPASATVTDVWVRDPVFPQNGWSGPFTVTAGDTVEVYEGGPQDSFTTTTPFTNRTATVDVVARTVHGTRVGLDVDVLGDGTHAVSTTSGAATPAQIQTNTLAGTPTVTSANWRYVSHIDRWDDLPTLRGTRTVTVERTLNVSGSVRVNGQEPGIPVPMKAVTTGGYEEDLGFTMEDGTFAFEVPATELYITPGLKGFEPADYAVDPAGGDVTNAMIELFGLPAPLINPNTFALNRFGAFVPYVTKSGDPRGFDEDNAAAALTMHWRLEAEPRPVSVAVSRAEGDPRPTTFEAEDAIDEVWLVDPRAHVPRLHANDAQTVELDFPTNRCAVSGFACSDDGDCGSDDFCAPGSYLDITRFHEILRTRQVLAFRGEPDGAGGWGGEIPLAKLPPGEFAPFALVITKLGAVRRLDYVPPSGNPPLRGYRIAPWMGTILDTIGQIDNSGFNIDAGNVFIPDREFNGMIDLAPGGDEGDPYTPQFLTYDYSVGGAMTYGMKTPRSGILSLGPSEMGFKAGVNMRMLVRGDSAEPVSILGGGSLSVSFAEKELVSVPSALKRFAKKAIPIVGISITPSVSIAVEKHAAIDVDGNTPEFEVRTKGSGKVAVKLTFPISSILYLLGPAAMPIVKLVNALVELQSYTELSAGGSLTQVAYTRAPDQMSTGQTVPRGEGPLRPGYLTTHHGVPNGAGIDAASLSFLAGYGIGLEVFGGVAGASIGLQLGGPADRREDVKLDVNTTAAWPLVKRATGAVSIKGHAGFKIACIKLDKTQQYDAIRFDVQFGTDPVFDVAEPNEHITYLSPATAKPAEFSGASVRLVDNVYKAGATSASASAVAWVSANPDDVALELWAAPRTGGSPSMITSAGGIADVVLAESDDGIVAAWSELTPEHVGDVFATSKLFFARSDDGGASWSAPVEIGDADGVAIGLDAATLDGDTVLVWGVPRGHVLSTTLSLWGTVLSGGTASTPERLFEPDRWRSTEVAAIGSRVLFDAHRGEHGTTMHRSWDGNWSEPTEIDEYVRSSVRVPGGRFYSHVTGGVWFHPDGGEPVLVSDVSAGGREMDAVVHDNGEVTVAWLQMRFADGVYILTVDEDGVVVEEEDGVAAGEFVILGDLSLVPSSDGVTALFTTNKRTAASLDEIEFPRGGEPIAPDLRDEGPSEDPTSLDALPTGSSPDDEDEDESERKDGNCLCTSSPRPIAPAWMLLCFVVVALRRWRRGAATAAQSL